MLSRKLLDLLETFSKYDLNRFGKYLQSPFFNENEDLIKLFDLLDDYFRLPENVREAAKAKLGKEKVWRQLYGKKKYNDAHLRRLCSELTKQAYGFITAWAYKSDALRESTDLLEALNDMKLEKHFNSTLRQINQLKDKLPRRDASFHYEQYRVENLAHLHLEQTGKQGINFENLEQADYHLDCFYFTQKLRHYCDALDHRNRLSEQAEISVFPDFLKFLEAHDYLRVPSVNAYYLVAQMLSWPEEENYFQQLKQLLREKVDCFTVAELNYLYIYLKNYCISTKINNGRSEYFQELFEIFKTLLEQEIIIINGKLDPQDYKNIITVGLHIEEFEWVKQFIRNYTKHLPEENQENALTYNLAKVFFHEENYDKVIEQLREVEYKNLVYALGSKLMLLRTYFELKEFIALDSLIDSFRIYLRRNKMISRDIKQQYLNVLRFVKKMSNLDIYDKALVQKVKKQIVDCKNLAAKKWLLDKIAEMEK